MKMLSTAVAGIMAMGLVVHAKDHGDEPRYKVFDVRMSGVAVGTQDDKGKEIYNGEVTIIDKVVKESRNTRGYLISDEFEEWESFLTIETGSYEQNGADMEAEAQHYDSKVVDETGKPFSYTEKGLAQIYLTLYLDDGVVDSNIIGNYSSSEKEMWKNGTTNTVFKFSFSGMGAGLGSTEGIYPISGKKTVRLKDIDPRIMKGRYVKNSKMKYNKKLSNLLSEAYAEEYAESGIENNAIEAAEEALNGFINEKAKIDDADYDLPS